MTVDAGRRKFRYWLASIAVAGMGAMYVLQRVDFLRLLPIDHHALGSYTAFIVNKSLRFLINDLCCLLFIFAFFPEKKYVRAALIVFIVEAIAVLPAYFIIKLSLEGDSEISSPLLSQIHRLIVNPILMMVLIAAFFYQRWKASHP